MNVLYAVVGALIILLGYFLFRKGTSTLELQAVNNFKFIGKTMERYVASWTPSPSDFVEKHQLIVKFNGEAEQVKADNLPSSTITVDVDFADTELGKSGVAFVRTFGDNGKTVDCAPVTFTVENQQVPLPVGNFSFAYKEHIV